MFNAVNVARIDYLGANETGWNFVKISLTKQFISDAKIPGS